MDADVKGVSGALAPSGVLRAAINFGNPVLAQRDGNGDPAGVSADLARELARRIGTGLRFVPFDTAGAVSASATANVWDVAFLADDPKRAADIFFTPAYVLIEGTYLVDGSSPLRAIEDVDRPGIRIAVGLGAAYDLHLTRTLRHAALVRCDGSQAALQRFLEEGLEAAAGIREALDVFAGAHPGLRVMEGSFMTIRQAMATPKNYHAVSGYLTNFIEEMKANGFVADALSRSGQSQVRIAPPGRSGD